MQPYQPSSKILSSYADVLVNYALNSGEGIKKGEVVLVQVPDVAKPLALALQNTILKAQAHPLIRLIPTQFDKDYFNLASPTQLKFFPANYYKAQVDLIDHRIAIIADPDPFELKSVDPQKIILARDSKKLYRDWLTQKEVDGKHTWTIALWGTQAKADIVGLSLKAYWQQIIQACFLDQKNPILKWKQVSKFQSKTINYLNDLKIQSVHAVGKDLDLHVGLGSDRIWQGGSGRNIPSFEIFTSPNWRQTSGWINFNQPLYRYGQVIKGISLKFQSGVITHAKATTGNRLLQEMIKAKNANKLGEYSLTDTRTSRITHPMAETLFDENVGGPFGNSHVAIGAAYKDCYRGDASKLSTKDWDARGFNDSPEHTDIMTTTDRTVTATLPDGSTKVIYKSGKFVTS